MEDRILGVDIGGTDIKFGIVEDGKVVAKHKIPTIYKDNSDMLVEYITLECKNLVDEYSVKKIGVGVPGEIKDRNIVVAPGNLPFRNTPLGAILSESLGTNVNIENDAKCAALGEAVFGEGKNFLNQVMITVGTGIGGAIIINKEIYRGRGAAGEIGHMIIEKDGKKCPCGQRGCLEQYISAAALIRAAEKAMIGNKESLLYHLYAENEYKIDGKIFFKALLSGCSIAEEVFDKYTDYFADGLKSVIMIFDPDIIVLSGGITKTGEAFIKPIVEKTHRDVPIKISSLQGDAGILGASLV